MSVTIPSLSDVTDILDTDMVMVTQSGGQTYKISGADLNKRNQAVIASSTTLTGAPLKTGNIVRVHFTADITGVNTTTALSLSYNGTSKTVKVPKDGALANFTAQNMGGSPTVYKYLQAYTTLEFLYDGTNFVIIGNPVVISSSDYTIYADGRKNYIKKNPKVFIGSLFNNGYAEVKIPKNVFMYSAYIRSRFTVLGHSGSNIRFCYVDVLWMYGSEFYYKVTQDDGDNYGQITVSIVNDNFVAKINNPYCQRLVVINDTDHITEIA